MVVFTQEMKEVFMSINTVMKKYSINHDEVNVIAACIMTNKSLESLVVSLGCIHSDKQAYALAKLVSEEIFSEDLDSTAPRMVLDRIVIAESEKESTAEKTARLRAENAQRIIDEDMALYVLEQENMSRFKCL
jgi:hypothetical protein